jgi:hypothetical protein
MTAMPRKENIASAIYALLFLNALMTASARLEKAACKGSAE